jgi:hypothetical protein
VLPMQLSYANVIVTLALGDAAMSADARREDG